MTSPGRSREGSYEPDALQNAKYLWEEYSYRHDMVWRLVFRVTAVSTALLIAPFLVDKRTQDMLGWWLIFLPILAVAVILLGFFALPSELQLLDKVRTAYRCEQDRALRHLGPSGWIPHPPPPSRKRTWWQQFSLGHFGDRVWIFMALMLAAAVAFMIFFVFVWLDKIQK